MHTYRRLQRLPLCRQRWADRRSSCSRSSSRHQSENHTSLTSHPTPRTQRRERTQKNGTQQTHHHFEHSDASHTECSPRTKPKKLSQTKLTARSTATAETQEYAERTESFVIAWRPFADHSARAIMVAASRIASVDAKRILQS